MTCTYTRTWWWWWCSNVPAEAILP